MIFRSSLFLLFYLILTTLPAQVIQYASSRSDYNLSDWIVYDSGEVEIGTLNNALLARDALQTWNLRLGEKSGYIKLRWKENPNEWDMRFNNDLISFKPTWPNQFDQWTINSNGTNYSFNIQGLSQGILGRMTNTANEEVMRIEDDFDFDPRDWTIINTAKSNDQLSLCGLFILINYLKVIYPR